MTATIYHPKGSMCLSCERKNEDCSGFGFNRMMEIGQYSSANDPTVFKVVRCDSFKQK